jgi:hypothetical protein
MNGVNELVAAVHNMVSELYHFFGLAGTIGMALILVILYLRHRSTWMD